MKLNLLVFLFAYLLAGCKSSHTDVLSFKLPEDSIVVLTDIGRKIGLGESPDYVKQVMGAPDFDSIESNPKYPFSSGSHRYIVYFLSKSNEKAINEKEDLYIAFRFTESGKLISRVLKLKDYQESLYTYYPEYY